ncbi:MAG: ECF-type sigma factor [Acidobacteriota bacterium]
MTQQSSNDAARAFQSMGDEERRLLVNRLTLYARGEWRRRRWRAQLPEGNDAKDLALEAIIRVLDGRRAWDAQARPELLNHLRDVVDSLLSNLVRSSDHLTRSGHDADDAEAHGVPAIRHRATQQQQLEAAEELERIRSLVADDPVLCQVLAQMEEGATPKEIAIELGLEVKDVNNHLRTIRRRVERHRAAAGEGR